MNVKSIKRKICLFLLSVIKKHVKKKSIDEIPNNKYGFESFAPKDEIIDGNEAAYEALNFALDLKKKNIRNIAISGPFGAGKSSLWRSYKNKKLPIYTPSDKIDELDVYELCSFRLPGKNDVLDISLAKFDEEKKETSKNDESKNISVNISNSNLSNIKDEKSEKPEIINANNINDNQDGDKIEFEIEKAILQQMLFSVNDEIIPCLNTNKISEKTNFFNIIISLMLPFLLLTGMSYYYEKYISWNYYKYSFVCFYVLMTILSIVLAVYAFKYLKKLVNLRFCKFSFKGLDVSFEESNGSLLNQNYAAIVYFFEKTQKKVVAFEDLDRFSSNKIFVKLRELNTILNNCPNINGPIKFVYMVKENLFTKYERTKFFEMIVPVIPVVNMESSADFLLRKKNLAKDEKNSYKVFNDINGTFQNIIIKENVFPLKNVDDKLLRLVGRFVNDLRILNDCVNEFVIYKEQLEKDLKDIEGIDLDNKIFAMIVYKNLYPQDFEDLHRHKSHLYNICKNYRYGKIDDDNCDVIKKYESQNGSLKECCQEMHSGVGRWIYWQCLKLELKYRYSHDDFEKSDSEKEKKKLDKIYDEETRERPSLIFDLLRNGYIDANSEFYVSRIYIGDLGIDDWRYLLNVQLGESNDYKLEIKKPHLLENKILDYQWKSSSVLNNRMVAYQLSKYNESNENEIVRGLISAIQNEKNNGFIKQFIDFLDYSIGTCEIAIENEEYAVTSNMSKKNIKDILFSAIHKNMGKKTLPAVFGDE